MGRQRIVVVVVHGGSGSRETRGQTASCTTHATRTTTHATKLSSLQVCFACAFGDATHGDALFVGRSGVVATKTVQEMHADNAGGAWHPPNGCRRKPRAETTPPGPSLKDRFLRHEYDCNTERGGQLDVDDMLATTPFLGTGTDASCCCVSRVFVKRTSYGRPLAHRHVQASDTPVILRFDAP